MNDSIIFTNHGLPPNRNATGATISLIIAGVYDPCQACDAEIAGEADAFIDEFEKIFCSLNCATGRTLWRNMAHVISQPDEYPNPTLARAQIRTRIEILGQEAPEFDSGTTTIREHLALLGYDVAPVENQFGVSWEATVEWLRAIHSTR